MKIKDKIYKQMIKLKTKQTKTAKFEAFKKYCNKIIDLDNPISKSKTWNPNNFILSPTTPDEISDIIQTLKLNKSTGPNSLP